ncbi:hypothetical protein Tsubulata_033395 [Turnera subulata]|uniref:Uncharacterized protein n=1 Tax=Turnera subulata TaxID=218843 RepID=A0A9Q0G8K9_9ROSI|nr:hypothetical protein Tsubulata_033395 [Turnera subulata]
MMLGEHHRPNPTVHVPPWALVDDDTPEIFSPSSGNATAASDYSPQALEASCARTLPFLASPDSVSPPADDSPPMSPMALSRSLGSASVHEMVASLRNLQLGKVKSMPSAWNVQVGGSGSGSTSSSVFGSPRGSLLRPGFCSLPTTPTAPAASRTALGYVDFWDKVSEEPAMERVESGRDLRARRYEKLCKENSLGRVESDPGQTGGGGPDVDWVSELVM